MLLYDFKPEDESRNPEVLNIPVSLRQPSSEEAIPAIV
jgi:hypothetical protein